MSVIANYIASYIVSSISTRTSAFMPFILLDTDTCTDPGDVGALQVLIALHKRSECNIAGIITNCSNVKAAPCVRAILDANGLTSVPVGAYQGSGTDSVSGFTSEVTSRFGNSSDTRSNYPSALTVARTVVEAAPPGVLTWCSIGFGNNLSAFLQSPPDGVSASTGSQLYTKLRSFELMAGDYPSGLEYNFQGTPADWNYIFANKSADVPTRLWGFNDGESVVAAPAVNGGVFISPSYYAFQLTYPSGRPCWDQMPVVTAVRGVGNLFKFVGVGGTNSVNASTGANLWTSSPGADSYYGKIANDSVIAAVISELMAETL